MTVTELEEDWSDLHAQTKDQLIREHIEMLEESRISTETMNRAKAKIDELRAENERLRAALVKHHGPPDGGYCGDCGLADA